MTIGRAPEGTYQQPSLKERFFPRRGDTLSLLPPIIGKYYRSIVNGSMVPPSEQDIAQLIEGYFPATPLVSLSQERTLFLRNELKEHLEATFTNQKMQGLAGNVFFIPEGEQQELRRIIQFVDYSLFITGSFADDLNRVQLLPGTESEEITKLTFLTSQQKMALYTDPSIYQRSYIIRDGFANPSPLPRWGNGRLFGTRDYNYGLNQEYMREMLAGIRARTGKRQLRALDIGGGIGIAAHDLEEFDPDMVATNFTYEPAIAMSPLRGGHIFGVAEQMPKEFKEKYDLILSNTAFYHMRFPQIALINGLYALSVNGVMDVEFDWGGSKYNSNGQIEMLGVEVPQVFSFLEYLQQEGFIDFLPEHHILSEVDQFGRTLQAGRVVLVKRRELSEVIDSQLDQVFMHHGVYDYTPINPSL